MVDDPLSCHHIMLIISRADKQPVLYEIPEVEPGQQQPGGEQQEDGERGGAGDGLHLGTQAETEPGGCTGGLIMMSDCQTDHKL